MRPVRSPLDLGSGNGRTVRRGIHGDAASGIPHGRQRSVTGEPMPSSTAPARLRLLPALAAPIAIILRRKPSKLYHVMLWRTDTDEIEHGSWFRGRIYEDMCDISPDGRWMAYFAIGGSSMGPRSWSALCRPPWLRAALYHQATGHVWGERGIFRPDGRVDAINWSVPLKSDVDPAELKDAPKIIFNPPGTWPPQHATLLRDGFTLQSQTKSNPLHSHLMLQPTPEHPAIRLFNPRSTTGRGRIEVDGLDLALDPARDWACYDSRGHLLIARLGRVERWSLRDLKAGQPGFVRDLESLVPPERPGTEGAGG